MNREIRPGEGFVITKDNRVISIAQAVYPKDKAIEIANHSLQEIINCIDQSISIIKLIPHSEDMVYDLKQIKEAYKQQQLNNKCPNYPKEII